MGGLDREYDVCRWSHLRSLPQPNCRNDENSSDDYYDSWALPGSRDQREYPCLRFGPCAFVNAVIQFGLSWLLFPLFGRFKSGGKVIVVAATILSSGASLHAQRSEVDSFQNAKRLYDGGRLAEAERSFLEITRHDPSNIAAQMYLGQTLLREEKFAEAIAPYERVRVLERAGTPWTAVSGRRP